MYVPPGAPEGKVLHLLHESQAHVGAFSIPRHEFDRTHAFERRSDDWLRADERSARDGPLPPDNETQANRAWVCGARRAPSAATRGVA